MEALRDHIDIEEYALTNQKPPKHGKYLIKIDKNKYPVSVETMTGREILQLAGKIPPEHFQLRQKLIGQNATKIDLSGQVDFTQPGIEKFMTIPLDQTEG
jgi:hypothetical protein